MIWFNRKMENSLRTRLLEMPLEVVGINSTADRRRIIICGSEIHPLRCHRKSSHVFEHLASGKRDMESGLQLQLACHDGTAGF